MYEEDIINVTFPVEIEWIIDDEGIQSTYLQKFFWTKTYNVPGFSYLTYHISFETELEKRYIGFYRSGFTEWESNLCLIINNGEPKKISQKFEEDTFLYTGSIEELHDSKKCILDPLILRINGTITVHTTVLSCEDEHITSCSKFKDLNEPTDFVIEVEKEEIQVHKIVLQYYSPVFSAMFENGWKEASEGRVVIPEFPWEIVDTVIKLCYGQAIYYDYDTPELILLYRFADKYDMEKIIHAIKEIILLTPNNICEYANFFHAENCPVFVSHCIDRLIVYFQFSYPVKDLDTLNTDIKLLFFTQASSSQTMKKEFNPDYHKNLNNEKFAKALPLL